MKVENDEVIRAVLLEFILDIVYEIFLSLTSFHADTVNVTVCENGGAYAVNLVAQVLMLVTASASQSGLDARTAQDIVDDVHVAGPVV